MLGAPVLLFVLLTGLLGLYQFSGGAEGTALMTFLEAFDLDSETSVPAWYATVLLALCAMVLAMISHFKRTVEAPYRRH